VGKVLNFLIGLVGELVGEALADAGPGGSGRERERLALDCVCRMLHGPS
jgi:hypothetical protein